MQFRIAVDAGGTFTDGVLMSAAGEAVTAKAQTTPRDPTVGTMNCISRLADGVGLSLRQMLEQTSTIVHGTTLATNVVATRSGAKMGTIATRGYRLRMTFPQVAKSDWVEQRRDMYDFHYDAPQPLTRNYLMTEVSERVNIRGEVLAPLDEEEVRKAVGYLKGHAVESIAVMLLHSALYPEHERAVARIVKEEYPSVHVSVSSVVLPVVGEVERWSTTMFSAYVAPAITGYVEKVSSVLKREGFNGELLFVQSNGGTATPDVVIANPATLLLSGPAAGPSLGLTLGKAHDVRNVLSVDMGGTSFDVGVVHDGMVDVVQQKIIDAMKYALPSVDVSAAGAGGGSIACIDGGGRLQVGP
jgi:N-methylhydantoinase A